MVKMKAIFGFSGSSLIGRWQNPKIEFFENATLKCHECASLLYTDGSLALLAFKYLICRRYPPTSGRVGLRPAKRSLLLAPLQVGAGCVRLRLASTAGCRSIFSSAATAAAATTTGADLGSRRTPEGAFWVGNGCGGAQPGLAQRRVPAGLAGDAEDTVVVAQLAAARNGAVAGDVRHRGRPRGRPLPHAELERPLHPDRGHGHGCLGPHVSRDHRETEPGFHAAGGTRQLRKNPRTPVLARGSQQLLAKRADALRKRLHRV